MFEVRGFAAHDAKTPLVPFTVPRRDVGAHDIHIEILYSGVCHSDLHQAQNDWATPSTRWSPAMKSSGA